MRKDISRPENWKENPYIGRDGKDYHSYEDLKEANAFWLRLQFPERKSFLDNNLTP